MNKVICTIIKNEQLFIDEWILYHLNLGFDHIYLYEDYGSRSHIVEYDKVTITPVESLGIPNYKSPATLQTLFDWCLKNINADWILFIDLDEFLILKDITLELLISEYEQYSGIWLDWKLFDSNGHIARPFGKVMDNYTRPLDENVLIDGNLRWNKKSFVNVKKANGWNTCIHLIEGGCNTDYNTNQLAKKCFKRAWVNHYFSKSWEDFVDRMFSRGNMNNYTRTCDQFFNTNPDLLPFKEILINSVRYIHTTKVMYISKDLKIISGGNIDIINKLKLKIIYGK